MARKEYQFKMPDGTVEKVKLDLPDEQALYEEVLREQRMTPEEYEKLKAETEEYFRRMGIL